MPRLDPWALVKSPRGHAVVAVVAAACALALADFDPPARVREIARTPPTPVGATADLPFEPPSDPDAAKVRVRLFAVGPTSDDIDSPPASDGAPATGTLLGAPVVTTVVGVEAHVEQAVRLDSNRTLLLHAAITPTRGGKRARGPVTWSFRVYADLETTSLLARGPTRRRVFEADGVASAWPDQPLVLSFFAGDERFTLLLDGKATTGA